MNIHGKICEFIETRLRNNAILAPFFNGGMGLYYETAGENPRKPYIRYIIQQPTIADGRNLQLEHNTYSIVVNINVNGNSIMQVRALSQAIFEEFDAILSPEGFPNIEDVKADYPDESFPFDAQTSKQLFETAQAIEFYFTI